jgi:hypothetical protein
MEALWSELNVRGENLTMRAIVARQDLQAYTARGSLRANVIDIAGDIARDA